VQGLPDPHAFCTCSVLQDGTLLRTGSVPLPPGCGGASLLRLSPDGATAVAAHASDHAVAVADVAARRLVARLIPGMFVAVTARPLVQQGGQGACTCAAAEAKAA
jgi:hypothetical protein